MAIAATCALSLVAILAGQVLVPAATSMSFYSFHAAAAVAYTLMGALIVPRSPRNVVGWLFLMIGFGSMLFVVSAVYGSYRLLGWVAHWSFPLSVGLVPLLLLVFPNGRLPSSRWRFVVWMGVAGLGVSMTFLAIGAWQDPYLLFDPEALHSQSAETALRLASGGLVLAVASMVGAVAALIARWRRADGATRQQIKVLAFGGVAMPLGFAVEFVFGLPLASLVLGAALPLTAGVAILLHGLYDLDLVLNRSLVYATITLIGAGIYELVATVLGPIFALRRGRPPLVATGVIAVLFHPLARRVQRGVNRILYGDRDEPYTVLRRLTHRLEQAADAGRMLPWVAETVVETLRLPYAGIELVNGDEVRLVAEHGRRILELERFAMTYQGEVVGSLLVTARSSSQPLSTRERTLLNDLAVQAGAAANTVRLTDALLRSRERLVRSREEERRRLRRDLHDGVGPALAGMTMQVGAARAMLPQDRARADRLLGQPDEQLQACVVESRRGVEDLRPPILDQSGLVQAIRQGVSIFAGAREGPVIEVVASELIGELPAAVEVAAYRIAIEAVTNAVRHAGAHRCGVELTIERKGLVVEIDDDGIGLTEHYRPGVGLTSMRERAEELGGTFAMESSDGGGTRIRARLPLATSS
ncbi:MAG TPA: sensor histidine kinase [Acidimicrobiales bacterium]|nr:sensor histidine kinase [Acidimicrobiales bacterium]